MTQDFLKNFLGENPVFTLVVYSVALIIGLAIHAVDRFFSTSKPYSFQENQRREKLGKTVIKVDLILFGFLALAVTATWYFEMGDTQENALAAILFLVAYRIVCGLVTGFIPHHFTRRVWFIQTFLVDRRKTPVWFVITLAGHLAFLAFFGLILFPL